MFHRFPARRGVLARTGAWRYHRYRSNCRALGFQALTFGVLEGMNTNTDNTTLALNLASARKGTFTGLITRKVGATRGSGANKMRYGDDLVHVCLYTGFDYGRLVERSREQLQAMDP